MRLSSKQSYRFYRFCRALPNNLISLLPTYFIAMDFDSNDAKFNIAAGALLGIASATTAAITALVLPILIELNNLLSSEDNK